MSATTPIKPRTSGIPTPGKTPTGRLRSFSSSTSSQPPLPPSVSDSEIQRAFEEAVRANDPSRHSNITIRPVSSQSSSASYARPPSVASGSRPKTPSNALSKSTVVRRPESRQSDVFSRTLHQFDVGDSVRIESLGFEGTLKFLGEIDGKQGIWAGVELSGGFSGKGKNDGSVEGKQYFSCPPKCGVFVAYSKLSMPTVIHGMSSRPPSVASTRASLSGRMTPSFSGRVTPSFLTQTPTNRSGRQSINNANGRITPSTGLGFSTPGNRNAKRTFTQPPPVINTPSASAMSKITAGSRASKYVGLTAQQLSARGSISKSPTRDTSGNSSRLLMGLGDSPSRSNSVSPTHAIGLMSPSSSGSSLATPKLGSRMMGLGSPRKPGSGRPSLATPKARVPSSVIMPPPPSPPGMDSGRSASRADKPLTPTFSSTSADTAVEDEGLSVIQQNSRVLQDKINRLLTGERTGTDSPPPRKNEKDDSLTSLQSSLESTKDRLQALLEENVKLKMELEETRTSSAKTQSEAAAREREREQLTKRINELEGQLKTSERSLDERNMKIESLERQVQSNSDAVESLRSEGETRTRDLTARLEDNEALISSLKEAVAAKADEAGQNEGIIQAKNAEIGLLEARVRKATSELEELRRDLTAQVDELRQAGQETIALYEERLSAADTKRYELEDQIESLNDQLKKRSHLSPNSSITQNNAVGHGTDVAHIDNEILREQVVHLQLKISGLEQELEDVRAATEKEDSFVRARVQKYKDSEVAVRQELTDAMREIDRIGKAEAVAKGRIEEIEEALRENTIALENARAEVEVLRANSEGVETDANGSFRRKGFSTNQEGSSSEILVLKQALSSLQAKNETLGTNFAKVQDDLADALAAIEHEKSISHELRALVEQKSSELENARKSANRDRPLTVAQDHGGSSKGDVTLLKQEITGLKHIVQELQKENAALANHSKLIESENKMLVSETDQLREEMKILEENVEQNLLREEQELTSNPTREQVNDRAKVDHSEVEHLRKKLADVEMKHARTVHDFNKEVSELETLVEAKIYREDELEREVERLKQKLSRGRRMSKSSFEMNTGDLTQSSIVNSAQPTQNGSADGGHCEVCEQPGHDIFSCPLLKDTPIPSSTDARKPEGGTKSGGGSEEVYCVDCETSGHSAADCPYSLDVF